MRLGALFIAICMLLIAGSAGATVYLGFGFAGSEAITVGLAVLMALVLYNTYSSRMAMRAAIGSQLIELTRGQADLARRVAEFDRRVAAAEDRTDSALARNRAATEPLAIEIGDLSTLVRQLADTAATQEARIAELAQRTAAPAFVAPPPAAPAVAPPETAAASPAPADVAVAQVTAAPPVETVAHAVAPEPEPSPATPALATAEPPAPAIVLPAAAAAASALPAADDRLPAIRAAIAANRIDLHLQPIVTLPQRKVRYYEALARLRSDDGDTLPAAEFVAPAETAGLMPTVDSLVAFRCVQVVRRLLLKNRDVGLFCNLSLATLADAAMFGQLLDFLEANRAIAPSLVLEFTHRAMRTASPAEIEGLAALAEHGFRFSLDNLMDLRIEPRELASRGFRFVKVPGSLLLDPSPTASDIHPADLSDLLGRFGIDLIAEKIEQEGTVVDLLDCDVRFGQGFLFSPPRPVRAEALQGTAEPIEPPVRAPAPPAAAAVGRAPAPVDAGGVRRGLAQLARGIVSRT